MFMCGSRKFCQRGSNSDVFFYEGDPSSTKSGPSLAASETPSTLNAGLVAV